VESASFFVMPHFLTVSRIHLTEKCSRFHFRGGCKARLRAIARSPHKLPVLRLRKWPTEPFPRELEISFPLRLAGLDTGAPDPFHQNA
jgi:hypothetical protein